MPIRASIVIPAYNMREKLARNLAALESQTETDFEAVVVDDGSTDGTTEYLRNYKGRIRLSVVSHPQNRGRAAARNSGVSSARGEVVILLDSDMVVLPDFVERHLSLHAQEKRVVIGNVLVAPWVAKSPISRYLDTRGVHKPRTSPPTFSCFATGNASVRREFLLQTGLFDQEIAEYGVEDLEMGYRLLKKGAFFIYDKRAISYHNHCYRLEDVLERVRVSGQRSIPIVLRKHPELKRTLRLDLLEPISFRTDSPRIVFLKLMVTLSVRERVYLLTKAAVSRWTAAYLPPLIFDYLLFYNRVAGFLQAKTGREL